MTRVSVEYLSCVGKCVTHDNGAIVIYLDKLGKYHRIDGPAKIRKVYSIDLSGNKNYFLEKQWFWHGEKININNQEQFNKILKLKAFL